MEHAIVLNIAVLVLAVLLDLALGEPKGRLHPVAWMGVVIDRSVKLAPSGGRSLP